MILPRTSPLNDLPGELRQYGLVIERWIVDESDGLKITAVVKAVSGEAIYFEDEVQFMDQKQRKPGKLRQMLADLYGDACRHAGQQKSVTLPGGLQVRTIQFDGVTRLLLARQGDVWPSDQEWATVLAHWPHDVVEEPKPEKFQHGGWNCMRGAWKTPEEQ